MRKALAGIVVFVGMSIALAESAMAYLDPSVTTYLLQVIVGIGVTCSAVFIIYFKKIKLFMKKKRNKRNKREVFVNNAKATEQESNQATEPENLQATEQESNQDIEPENFQATEQESDEK